MADIQTLYGTHKLNQAYPIVNANFTELASRIASNALNDDAISARINSIVAQAGGDNTEIVDARGIYTVLRNRLDAMDNKTGINILYPPAGLTACKGDGVFDNTVALQAIIDYVPAGSRIYCPEGTYIISNIIINKPVTFCGAGFGTIFKKKSGASGRIFEVGKDNVQTYNMLLADFMVHGNYVDNSTITDVGIYCMGIKFSQLVGIRVEKVAGHAYQFAQTPTGSFHSNTVHLLECWAYSCNGNAVRFDDATDDMHIFGGDYGFCGFAINPATGEKHDGIYFGCPSSTIRNSTIWSHQGNGVYINWYAPSGSIMNNAIEGNRLHGIYCKADGMNIIGNKIYDNANTQDVKDGNGNVISYGTTKKYDGIMIHGETNNGYAYYTKGVNIIGNSIYSAWATSGGEHRYQINLGNHSDCTVFGNALLFNGLRVRDNSRLLVNGLVASDYTDYSWTKSYFEAYIEGSISLPTASWTDLIFATKVVDTETEFNGTTFTPKYRGVYQFNIAVMLNGTNSGLKQLRLYKNGTTEYRLDAHKTVANGDWTMLHGTISMLLEVGDSVKFQAYAYYADSTMVGSNITRLSGKLLK